jgi:hypothetical protein
VQAKWFAGCLLVDAGTVDRSSTTFVARLVVPHLMKMMEIKACREHLLVSDPHNPLG